MSLRSKSPDTPLAIEVEIQSEKASALRRVASRLESLLVELVETEKAVRGLSGPSRERLVARHQELRAEAEKQRWYLIVQREAMGLRHHGDIYELYRLPGPVE
jgi:Na+/phosphate symporter